MTTLPLLDPPRTIIGIPGQLHGKFVFKDFHKFPDCFFAANFQTGLQVKFQVGIAQQFPLTEN